MTKFGLAAGAIIFGAGLVLGACGPDGAGAARQAEDAASVPVGQTSARVMGSHQVAAYATNAFLGDLYEVISADIALQRTGTEEVRAMARRLRTEHSAARAALEAAVQSDAPGLVLPSVLDKRRQGLVDNLQEAPSGRFDRIYLDQQIAAHEEAVTLHRGFADHAASRSLAIHALTVLTGVEDDLAALRRLRHGLTT